VTAPHVGGARARMRAPQREVVAPDRRSENGHATPQRCMSRPLRRPPPAPRRVIQACLPRALRDWTRSSSRASARPRDSSTPVTRFDSRAAARAPRVARQVQALEHARHRGRQLARHRTSRAPPARARKRTSPPQSDLLQPFTTGARAADRHADATCRPGSCPCPRTRAERISSKRLLHMTASTIAAAVGMRVPVGRRRYAGGCRGRPQIA